MENTTAPETPSNVVPMPPQGNQQAQEEAPPVLSLEEKKNRVIDLLAARKVPFESDIILGMDEKLFENFANLVGGLEWSMKTIQRNQAQLNSVQSLLFSVLKKHGGKVTVNIPDEKEFMSSGIKAEVNKDTKEIAMTIVPASQIAQAQEGAK